MAETEKDRSEIESLRAEVKHWKDHAEEAGVGFTRVCEDAARISARNVALGAEREQAEAIIADLRARVSHYEALVVAVRGETLERAAAAIEGRRGEHWQRHLREHPYADGTSCPGDYAAHDAYYDSAKIVRALTGGESRG